VFDHAVNLVSVPSRNFMVKQLSFNTKLLVPVLVLVFVPRNWVVWSEYFDYSNVYSVISLIEFVYGVIRIRVCYFIAKIYVLICCIPLLILSCCILLLSGLSIYSKCIVMLGAFLPNTCLCTPVFLTLELRQNTVSVLLPYKHCAYSLSKMRMCGQFWPYTLSF
jgi:hypothetical protein